MCDLNDSRLKGIAKEAIEKNEQIKFEIRKHVKFLTRHLHVFPEAYNSLDSSRATLLYFTVSALDLLGELDSVISKDLREKYIDWIYSLQLTKGITHH